MTLINQEHVAEETTSQLWTSTLKGLGISTSYSTEMFVCGSPGHQGIWLVCWRSHTGKGEALRLTWRRRMAQQSQLHVGTTRQHQPQLAQQHYQAEQKTQNSSYFKSRRLSSPAHFPWGRAGLLQFPWNSGVKLRTELEQTSSFMVVVTLPFQS